MPDPGFVRNLPPMPPRPEPVEGRAAGDKPYFDKLSTGVHFALGARKQAALVFLFSVAVGLGVFAGPATALEEQAGEAKAIEACDKRLCSIVQTKEATGDDLKCALSKTWARSTLKEADQRDIKWMFGDARCSVQINLSRAKIVEALTGAKVKFWVPPHTANCIVEENGKVEKVTATLGPKIVFENGRATKVWVNLRNVEGPAGIKATLQTAAQLNDSLGLFHRAMVKSVNRYIEKHCPKYHPVALAGAPAPTAKPSPPETEAAKPGPRAGEPAQN